MRKEAEEESGKRSEMVGMRYEIPWDAEDAKDKEQLMKKREDEKQINAREHKALVASEEELSTKKTREAKAEMNSAGGKLAKKKYKKEKMKNTKMEGGSGKPMVMEQQSKASPRGKKNPMLLNNNRFGTLDIVCDEETDEMDRGKSAIEEDLETTILDPSSTSSMTIQDDHDSEMDFEAERFDSHHRSWESNWSRTCGSFEDITVLTSMQFTHHTPGLIPLGSAGYNTETLQIFSIKLTDIAGGLQLPLSVYGVVAARDIVDHNRNILFYCSRSEAQELKQNDPFLHLFGPSRAIVSTDMVYIEIELKVKGALESQDKPLMTYGCGHNSLSNMCFKNNLCTLELCSQQVRRTIQATILGVRVVKGEGSSPLNFKYGGLVACTPLSGKFVFRDGGVTRMKNPSSNKIVLLDSKDGPMPEGVDGYLHLWRQVVSVEFEGGLDVVIQAYSESGGIAAQSCVHLVPKNSNISRKKISLSDAQITITVAWSLVPTDNFAAGKLAKKNDTNTPMEGGSGQQSKVSPHGKKNLMQQLLKGAYMLSGKKNPNEGEEAVTEGSGKPAMDEEVISPETDKETLQQLVKDMSNKLDHGGDKEEDEMDRGKSAIEEDSNTTMVDPNSTNSVTIRDVHDSEMDLEAKRFALYRRSWESNWSRTCGSFEDRTVLTSMQFTHHTPGFIPLGSAGYMTGTLQILSIKLTDSTGVLQLPLSVYGMVAARDIVDRNRNILFNCNRSEAQELKRNDPFLHLSGPPRAIVNTDDTVYIEIELKVKGAVESQDKPLMTCVRGHSGLSTMCFKNDLCTLELCSQRVGQTVQATILGVRIVKGKGSCPPDFKYGGLVTCTPLSGEFVFSDEGFTRMCNPSSDKIVLLESKDGPMPEGVIGYLDLWRQVVSVEFEGGLDIAVQAYSECGTMAEETCVHFMPKKSNISQKKSALGDAEVTITVAWSLVPTDKDEVVSKVGRRRWDV